MDQVSEMFNPLVLSPNWKRKQEQDLRGLLIKCFTSSFVVTVTLVEVEVLFSTPSIFLIVFRNWQDKDESCDISWLHLGRHDAVENEICRAVAESEQVHHLWGGNSIWNLDCQTLSNFAAYLSQGVVALHEELLAKDCRKHCQDSLKIQQFFGWKKNSEIFIIVPKKNMYFLGLSVVCMKKSIARIN